MRRVGRSNDAELGWEDELWLWRRIWMSGLYEGHKCPLVALFLSMSILH